MDPGPISKSSEPTAFVAMIWVTPISLSAMMFALKLILCGGQV